MAPIIIVQQSLSIRRPSLHFEKCHLFANNCNQYAKQLLEPRRRRRVPILTQNY